MNLINASPCDRPIIFLPVIDLIICQMSAPLAMSQTSGQSAANSTITYDEGRVRLKQLTDDWPETPARLRKVLERSTIAALEEMSSTANTIGSTTELKQAFHIRLRLLRDLTGTSLWNGDFEDFETRFPWPSQQSLDPVKTAFVRDCAGAFGLAFGTNGVLATCQDGTD